MVTEPATVAASDRRLCTLREDLEVHPIPGDVFEPAWTLHDPITDRFYRIGWRVFDLLRHWRDGGSAAEVMEATRKDSVHEVTEDEVVALDGFLRRHCLCRPQPEDAATFHAMAQAARPGFKGFFNSLLFFKVPLIRPDHMLERLHDWLGWMFTRTFVYFIVAISVLALWFVSRQWDIFLTTFAGFITPAGVVSYSVAIVGCKLVHEFAHALCLHHLGLHVPAMGISIMAFVPLPYTEAGWSWLCRTRCQRMMVSAAGILAEMGLGAICALVWLVLGEGPWRNTCFIIASINWISSLIFNLNPLMRLDGYHLLVDISGVDNLQSRAISLLKRNIGSLFLGFRDASPEELSARRRLFMVCYALCAGIYRPAVIIGIALAVYHYCFRALGMALLIWQIFQWIVRPVFMQVKRLVHRRREMKLTFASKILLGIILSFIGFVVLPTDSSIRTQGLMTGKDKVYLYALDSGFITAAPHGNADKVRKGDVVFAISSPEQEHVLELGKLEIERCRRELAVIGFTEEMREKRLVLQTELTSRLAVQSRLVKEMNKLVTKSPVDGQIVVPDEPWKAGDPVGKNDFLGIIMTVERPHIVAYLTDLERQRLHTGADAQFLPAGQGRPLRCRLEFLDEQPASAILESGFLSCFGGVVPVAADERHSLTGTVYRACFALVDPCEVLAGEVDGTVRIEADRQIPIVCLWRKIRNIAVRELTF